MIEGERPGTSATVSSQLESVKHLLWQGNVEEALERLTNLLMDLELIGDHSGAAEKLAAGVAEFQIYIRNNQGVHSQLRRALSGGRNDQHGIR